MVTQKEHQWTHYEEVMLVEAYSSFPRQWRRIRSFLLTNTHMEYSRSEILEHWFKSFPDYPTEKQRNTILWIFGQILGMNKRVTADEAQLLKKQAIDLYASEGHQPDLEAILADASKSHLLAPPRVSHPFQQQHPQQSELPSTPQIHQGSAAAPESVLPVSGALSSLPAEQLVPPGSSPVSSSSSMPKKSDEVSSPTQQQALHMGGNSPASLRVWTEINKALLTALELSGAQLLRLANEARGLDDKESDRREVIESSFGSISVAGKGEHWKSHR